MIGAARRYAELMLELLLERELAGGELPEAEESRRVAELDRCWWAMTNEEQADYERWLAASKPPDAPAELELKDVIVSEGSTSSPRAA